MSVFVSFIALKILVKTRVGRKYLRCQIEEAEMDDIYFNREYADPRRDEEEEELDEKVLDLAAYAYARKRGWHKRVVG